MRAQVLPRCPYQMPTVRSTADSQLDLLAICLRGHQLLPRRCRNSHRWDCSRCLLCFALHQWIQQLMICTSTRTSSTTSDPLGITVLPQAACPSPNRHVKDTIFSVLNQDESRAVHKTRVKPRPDNPMGHSSCKSVKFRMHLLIASPYVL